MQEIAANTASQVLYLTLNEARQYLSVYTHYLIEITNNQTNAKYYLIPVVTDENDRITTLTIGLNVNNAVNGSIQITQGGEYIYTIYGQNSSSNLDPLNAAVVGEVETGWIKITDETEYTSTPAASIPAFKSV